jgi:hypothetical protein
MVLVGIRYSTVAVLPVKWYCLVVVCHRAGVVRVVRRKDAALDPSIPRRLLAGAASHWYVIQCLPQLAARARESVQCNSVITLAYGPDGTLIIVWQYGSMASGHIVWLLPSSALSTYRVVLACRCQGFASSRPFALRDDCRDSPSSLPLPLPWRDEQRRILLPGIPLRPFFFRPRHQTLNRK